MCLASRWIQQGQWEEYLFSSSMDGIALRVQSICHCVTDLERRAVESNTGIGLKITVLQPYAVVQV